MAITVAMREQVTQLYVSLFARAPEADGLGHWVKDLDNGSTFAQVAQRMFAVDAARALYPSFLTNDEIITKFYTNVIGRKPDAEGLAHWTKNLNDGKSPGAVIADMITATVTYAGNNAEALQAKALFNNKVAVGLYYAVEKGGNNVAQAVNVLIGVTDDATSVTSAKASIDTAFAAGQTFALTAGIDTPANTAGNDIYNALDTSAATPAATLTAMDAIDGGQGTDTLNVVRANSIDTTAIAGLSVRNVENINITASAAITADTSSWTGATQLTTATTAAAQTLTAAATTNVTATTTAVAANNISVNGGNNVSVTNTGGSTGTITVGNTTAAAGDVVVSNTTGSTGGVTMGAIAVTGGKTVTVNTAGGNAVGTTDAMAAVTVTGNANTTAVTVSQAAAATAAAASGTVAGVRGITNGDVTIHDANRTEAARAGTITTVTLNSFKAATIDSSAINTVNLSGKGTSVDIGRGNLSATPTANTLTVNVNGLALTGTLTDIEAASDDGFTTVNIDSSTAASTLGTAASGANAAVNGLAFADATTVNVSGNALFTSRAESLTSVTAINVTNTAGASFGTEIGANVTFTGGAGADGVVLANAFTKAINMGAGNDTVTYGGAASTTTGARGSVDAGDGTDTIIMTAGQANTVSGSSVFNASFKGFETLRISDALNTTVDLDGVNAASKVILRDGSNVGTLNNLVSGGTVDVVGQSAGSLAVNVKGALVGASDTLNVNLLNTSAITGAQTLTAANVETVNIGVADAASAPALASNAVTHTLTLVATEATTVTVAGNNGLTLTNTGNTKITNFDASGVVGNSTAATPGVAATTDGASSLAVTFASANTTASAVVTITGGAGNDTLSGNASKDTINGGAGVDTIRGGAGQDTLTGGAGADVFAFGASDSAYNAIDVITDLSSADSIVYDNATLAFSGAVTGTGTTATISSAGVATFSTIVGVASATLVDKIRILDETLSTDGRAVLFAQDGVTYMYINTDTATTADLTGVVIQLTGVALPASPTTDGSTTGLSGFGA